MLNKNVVVVVMVVLGCIGNLHATGIHMIGHESYDVHASGIPLVSGGVGLSPDMGTNWILSHVQPQLSPVVTDTISYSGGKAQKSVRYNGSGQGVFTGFGTGVSIDVTKQYIFSCMFMAANDLYAATNCGNLFISAGPAPSPQIVGSVYLNGYGNHLFGTWDNDGGGYVYSTYNPIAGKWYKLELVVSIGAFDSIQNVYPVTYDSFVTDDLGVRTQLANDFAAWQNLTPAMVAWGWEINTGADANPNPGTTNTIYFDELVIAEVITADSATWENKYECDTMPVAAGWTAAGGFEANFTSQASGILKLDSLNTVVPDYTGKLFGWYTKASGVDFATGATIEIRAKLINAISGTSAYLSMSDGDQYIDTNFYADGTNTVVKGYTVGALNEWCTIRITVKNGESVKWYLGDSPTPFYSESIKTGTDSILTLGDLTGSNGNESNWEIDYIRWTGVGAFVPPQPQVTADSATWENKYECDAMPVAAGWTAAGGFEANFTSQVSGILKLDSLNTVVPGYTGKLFGWYTKNSGVDFATGATIEIRAKLINAVSGASAYLSMGDGDQYIDTNFYADGANTVVKGYTVATLNEWCTIRITVKNGESVKWYLGDSPTPFYSESIKTGTDSILTLGDLTSSSGNESNWDIDYIRWTNAGAFVPPQPPATSSSDSWEGKYECDTMPAAAGWAAAGGFEPLFTSQAGGILKLDSLNAVDTWYSGQYTGKMYGWYTKPSDVNFATGATVEIRARLISAISGASAYFTISDGDKFSEINFSSDGGSMTRVRNVEVAPLNEWVTIRLTIKDGEDSKWYLGNSPSPFYSEAQKAATDSVVWLGDATSGLGNESNWEIDYIRWTKQGAFAPAACGDAYHPILPGDVTQDCMVDINDLKTLVADWLQPPLSSPSVTPDSSTWEGRYEGDEYPDLIEPVQDSWTAQGEIVDITFLDASGFLNIDSFDLDKIGFFEKTISSNFADGFTLEMKARVNASESVPGNRSASASLICYDNAKNYFLLRLDNDKVSLGELGDILIDPKGAFHTYRIAAVTGTNMLKVWVDGNPAPALNATLFEVGTLANTVQFGDLTVAGDADWDIDYLRWTGQGAFPPAGAAGYCGDGFHQPRDGDINRDCSVNMSDFSLMAQDWLVDNQI